MVRKADYVDGRAALRRLDQAIAEARVDLRRAMSEAEEAHAGVAAVRNEQLDEYRQLADVRLDVLRDGEGGRLDALHRRADDLLKQHEDYVAEESIRLEEAAEDVARLEEQRASLTDEHALAVEAYEEKVAEVQARLADDPAYRALEEAHTAAEAIAVKAREKLALAETDRAEKGRPYDQDPLFTYLWKRHFKTPNYEAKPFFRTLDQWVSGLIDYEDHYLNYDRLTQLPVRLAEHVETVEEAEDDALNALEMAERDALNEGGAHTLAEKAETLFAQMTALDTDIERAEVDHHTIINEYEAARKAQKGPAAQARTLLEEGLQKTSLPALRVLVAESATPNDDVIVDRLVHLEADRKVLSSEAEQVATTPTRRRRELEDLEDLRRQFKSARFDSAYAEFRSSAFEETIHGLARGSYDADNAYSRLRRSMRRRPTRTHTGFGGRRRRSTMGLPEVMGEVMWEVARQAGRGGFGGGFGGSHGSRSRGSSRPPSIPRSRRSSGGFRTGRKF